MSFPEDVDAIRGEETTRFETAGPPGITDAADTDPRSYRSRSDPSTSLGRTDPTDGEGWRRRSAARRPADDGTRTAVSGPGGVKVVPNVDVTAVTVTVSAETRGASTVAVTDTEGTTLASESFPGPSGSVRLESPLTAGLGYYVLVDGAGYDQGYYSGPAFPYTAPALHVTDGVLAGGSGGPVEVPTSAYAIKSVGGDPRRGAGTDRR